MPCCDVTAWHYYSQLMTTTHASWYWPAAARFTEHGQLGIVTGYRPASSPTGHAPCSVILYIWRAVRYLYHVTWNTFIIIDIRAALNRVDNRPTRRRAPANTVVCSLSLSLSLSLYQRFKTHRCRRFGAQSCPECSQRFSSPHSMQHSLSA